MSVLRRFILAVFWLLTPVFAAAQTIGTINFNFDSSELDATALAEIQSIADQLNAAQSYKPTVVVGYTDAVGAPSYNIGLGQRRAQAVADALVAAGAPVDRIGTIESRGENELLVAVATAERANRRVTVTLGDMLAACRSYRSIALDRKAIGDALQADLVARLQTAVQSQRQFRVSGGNSDAYQMAGAAREDCTAAVGYAAGAERKLEYAKRCFCSSARLSVALGQL